VAIVHRDLKPSNVLLSGDGRDAKLCDFGLYRLIPAQSDGCDAAAQPHALPPRHALQSPAPRAAERLRVPETSHGRAVAALCAHTAAIRLTARTGTICYMAPELWGMTGRYGAKVDVFSFGVLAWEVLSQRRAYDDVAGRPEELITKIAERGLRPRLPASWPPELAQLLRACWSADAALRPSAERVAAQIEAFVGLAGADGGRRHAQLGMAGRRAVADERMASPCTTLAKTTSSSALGSALRLRRPAGVAAEHATPCCVIS
jgi:serine/threonine protein kinase